MKEKPLISIQVLRGIASLIVFYHHLSGNFSKTCHITSPHAYFSYGFFGVDIFFVLSGFIIYKSSQKLIGQPHKLKAYFGKRFKRVFPIYWLITLPLLLTSFLIAKSNYVFSFKNILATLMLLPNHDAINAVSWTLSYELFFYIIFGLFILSNRLVYFGLLILGISLFNIFSGYFGDSLIHKSEFYFYVSPFNFEFFAGIIIAKYFSELSFKPIYSLFLILISLVILIKFGPNILDDVTNIRVLTFGSVSILILLSFLSLENWSIANTQAQNIKPSLVFLLKSTIEVLAKMGDASYMLYLIHFPIIIITNRIIASYTHSILISYCLEFLILLFIPCMAYVLHKKTEKPLLQKIK